MTKQTDSKTNVENLGKMPRLRFPEFQGKWETKEIGQIMKIGSGKDYKHLGEGDIPVFGTGGYMTSVNDYLMNGETICIGRKGTINKPFYHCGKFWTVDTLFYTHSFKNTIPRFALYIFEKINWLQYNEASGVPSLSKSTIEQIEISIPFLPEQKKIASLLSLIDERIECQRKIINQLETAMRIIREKIFNQQIRFKDENGNYFTDWIYQRLGKMSHITTGRLDANAMIENGDYRFYTCAKDFYKIDKYAFDTEALLISGNGANVGYIHYYKGRFNAYQRTYVLDDFRENILYVKYFLDTYLEKRINLEKKEGEYTLYSFVHFI